MDYNSSNEIEMESEMNLYKFVGGEFVDPMIPDSIVQFKYSVIAETLFDAVDVFYKLFPSCFLMEYQSEYI